MRSNTAVSKERRQWIAQQATAFVADVAATKRAKAIPKVIFDTLTEDAEYQLFYSLLEDAGFELTERVQYLWGPKQRTQGRQPRRNGKS